MKKSMSNISSMLIIIFLLINILIHPNYVSSATSLAFDIWKNNLFPFLFPMFVISEVMISLNAIDIFSNLGNNIITKLFKVKKECTFILIMSMLSGFPSSAKYINSMYEKGILNDNDASKILMFAHFSIPLFIIDTISSTFLGNIKLAKLIFLSHYLTNILIGIMFRNYNPIKKENNLSSFKYSSTKESSKSLGVILGNAIVNSINTLLLILGTISIFLLITTILNSTIDLGNTGNAIINGIIEMSQGLKYVSMLEISLHLKTTLSVMIISFGGLSVHLQVMSILSNTKVKYLPFLLSRIIHALIAGLIAFLIFPIM